MTLRPSDHDHVPNPPTDELSRLRDLALQDELTGMANRRAFLERMQEAFNAAAGGGPLFSLVLLDVDGLKDINDTFGYQAGDRALQEFATALVGAVRADDLVARIGGDEFAVVAIHRERAEAQALFERLRGIARGVVRPLKRGGPEVIISAAVGQGVWEPETPSMEAVFTTAEGELATAKAAPPPGAEGVDAFRPRGRRALGEELRALLAMARQVTTASGVSDLLRRVTEQAAGLVGAEVAAIALLTGERVVRVDEIWRDGAWEPFVSERPLGEGVLGRTAASGTPEVHNALTPSITHDRAGAEALGLRSVLCVPLRDRLGTTFGVLALFNKRGRQDFQESDVGLTQAFADLAASSIENARSFSATEEARAYQRALMEQAHDAIMVVDPAAGCLLDVNMAMTQLTGYPRDELLRLTLAELNLAAPEIVGRLADATHSSPFVLTLTDGIRRKDGTPVPVELSGSHVSTQRGLQLLLIVHDMRERLAAEAALRGANDRLRALTEQAGDAIIRTDPRGAMLDANAMAEQIFGVSRADLRRLRLIDVLDTAERSRLPQFRRQLRRDGQMRMTVRLRRADRTTFAAEVTASAIEGEVLYIVRNIEERLAVEAETLRRNQELEARNAVAALLTESRAIGEALEKVLPIILRAAEMDGALVMLADDAGRLRLAAELGVPPVLARVLQDTPPRFGELLLGGAAASRAPMVVNDVATDQRLHWEATRQSGLGAFAILPLVVDNRALGLLAAGSFTPGTFDDRRVTRLRAFADQIAVWLDSRLLLEATEVREQDARFLADLGESLNQTRDEGEILHRLTAGLAGKFGGGALALMREGEDTWQIAASAHTRPAYVGPLASFLRSISVTVGYGEMVRRARPSLVDLRAGGLPEGERWVALARQLGLETLIMVPLSAGGEVLGILAVGNRPDEPLLTQRHLALAQEVSQHAALAVSNARAYRTADRSQAFLRARMEQAGEAILVFDAEVHRIIDANAAAEALTGRPRAALVGLGVEDVILPRDQASIQRLIAGLAAEGGAEQWMARVRHTGGRVLTAAVSASRVAADGHPVVMALLRDVTAELAAQRQRERLLRRVRDEAERSRQLLDLAAQLSQAEGPDGVMHTALDACRRLANVGRAGILLWNVERRAFVPGDAVGLTEEDLAILGSYVVDSDSPGFARSSSIEEPVLISDAHGNPNVSAELAQALDVHAAVLIPLRAGGELLGLLAADRTGREQTFAKRDVAMLNGIAQQTAMALAAARSRQRVEVARDYLQTIMGQAGDGIVVTEIATSLVADANERLCQMVGLDREQVVGHPLSALVVPEQRDLADARLDAIRRGESVRPVRRRDLLRPDGGTVPVEISNNRVTVGGRDLLVAVVRDLRGRLETERQLRFQAQVLASMRDAVIALDRDGRVVLWNRGAEVLFGWTEAEMLGALPQDSVTAGGLPYLNALVARLAEDSVADGEVPFARKDGSRMWCQVTMTRLRDEQGAPAGLIGIVRDITQQRAAAARLRTFAQIVSNAGETIAVMDSSCVVTYANPAAHAILGYPEGALAGVHGHQLLADDTSPTVLQAIVESALGRMWRGELDVRRADGSRVVLRVSASRLLEEDGEASASVVIVGEDITAEREAQAAQQALLARLAAANATTTKRTIELRAVADVAAILVAGGEPESVFAALARRILAVTTYDVATISLYDAARDATCLRQVQHRLAADPPTLAANIGVWHERSTLPILVRLMRERRPPVIRPAAPIWQSSMATRTVAGREGFSLTVATPLIYNGEFVGVLMLYAKADRAVPAEEVRLLQALGDQVAAAVHNVATVGRIREMRRDAIFRLALACETRDADTGLHLRGIQSITETICRELGLPEPEVEETALGSVLHDVGKIAVPVALLRKAEPLTPEEIEAIRLHTVRGEEMLGGPDFYATARQIARHHHERWDGSGYPDGLAGLAIPRPARIVAVADVYDALVSRRAYKAAWSDDAATRYILDHTGRHFDPEVAAAFEAAWRGGRLDELLRRE